MVSLRARSFVLAALVALATASPTNLETRTIHERRVAPAPGFIDLGPAPADDQLKLRIALKSTDIVGLEKELMAVSDPSSTRYGQHLTPEQVAEYVKPTADTLSAVTSWLDSNNIASTSISPAGDLLQIQIPVSKANSLLSAEFSLFKHANSNETNIRTLQYSLPASLAPHVAYLHPTTSFTTSILPPNPKLKLLNKVGTKRAVDASCLEEATPACLQELYGIPSAPATQKNNVLGVSAFSRQFAIFEDLQSFLTELRPDIDPTTRFDVLPVDGGANTQLPSNAGLEANLDIQYTVGLATNVPVTFIAVGDRTTDGVFGFVDEVNALIALSPAERPTVLTTSYGFNEFQLTQPVAQGLCNAYLQLTVLGTSILFASGDGGVGGVRANDTCTVFNPTEPAGCPWITTVGATELIEGDGGLHESGVAFSSGGFSNHFATPDYQKQDIDQFIASLDGQYDGQYNASGRGFPDVSALGMNFVVYSDRFSTLVGGTSASSPIFASIISLLNDELIGKGKSPLGFLNPFLYSAAGRAALSDITNGTNPSCGTDGFSATSGWDPITGLGTPNYAKLRQAVGLA
ncbi:family S53 protease-like protein [Favolaschia claudopus]|uniref:Family S53 protease-like protein n=1 Tax=Favolaschia claudopus TaxID=2862362 RepID=A0AAW0AYJ4_9AGAR